MPSFDRRMQDHQISWRKAHVESEKWGWQKGVSKPWILPKYLWEEGLWPGIRTRSGNSLPAYLEKTGVQKHDGVHNLKSSWVLCANLYFPFQATADGRSVFASFLKCFVDGEIDSLEKIELEYAEHDELDPAHLLGEKGGTRGAYQTSPDLGLCVNGGSGLVLVENKFVEKNFYICPGSPHYRNSSRKTSNPYPDRCKDPVAVVADPSTQCYAHTWGVKYWERLAAVGDRAVLGKLPHCPAAKGGYQLFRQHALAEGIAQSGKYDLVVSAVAIDQRNDVLRGALKSSGIEELEQWGAIFRGKAKFAVFTHQEWVEWVEQHDSKGQWSDWLRWVRERYQL